MIPSAVAAFCLALLVGPAAEAGAGSHLKFKGPLTAAALQKFIDDNDIRTEDEFLAAMPSRLMENFTLGHESDALFKACVSRRYPRAIVFSPEDGFIMTFNGNPDVPHCKSNIEIAEFNQAERRIHPALLRFSEDPAATGTPKLSVDDARCQGRCHTPDFHPNWSSYPAWPKFFGGHDDFIEPGTDYAKEFLGLREHWKAEAPYRYLAWKKTEHSLPNPGPKSLTRARFDMFPYDPDYKGLFENRPNFRLTTMLMNWHAQRVARQLEKSEKGSSYRAYLIASYLDCTWTKKYSNPGDLVPGQYGLSAEDFNVNFQDDGQDKRPYRAYFDGKTYVAPLAVTELLRSLAASRGWRKPATISTVADKGESLLFEPHREQFAWVDEHRPLDFLNENNDFCEPLLQEHLKQMDALNKEQLPDQKMAHSCTSTQTTGTSSSSPLPPKAVGSLGKIISELPTSHEQTP